MLPIESAAAFSNWRFPTFSMRINVYPEMTINVSISIPGIIQDQRIPHTLILLIKENAEMSEQLSLLDWPPAEVLPFPFHRSHGATIAVARSIVNIETAKRSGKLNSIRAQTRKRLEPLIGVEQADKAADDLIRAIKVGFAYCENATLHKQKSQSETVISLSTRQPLKAVQHGDGAGEASALGQGTKFLAGLGGAHERPEYDAARAREGGAA
ncbi:UNVERIFIED_ORG: hypothetical protein J2W66_003173 [Agrobacterium larrymoorei]|nr:hypothetical protein [Agrobacterium larrymoorei]